MRAPSILPLLGCGWAFVGKFRRAGMRFPVRILGGSHAIAEGGHEVHYDLLTGQLLINGKPLGRLPQKIVEHPTYASVLGTVSRQDVAFSDLF
jgi:hypothetical protein